MKKQSAVALLIVTTAISLAQVAAAKVLREGQPANGYYWQLVEKKTGATQLLCRSIHSNRIQIHNACKKAGAKKP